MSLVPAFEIGLWNAWIPMLYTLLLIPIVMLINKSAAEEDDFTSGHSKTEKKILYSYHIIYFVAVIYSVFLPLQLGTIWFYIGLPVCLLGLIFYTMVMVSFATTPLKDEPMTNGLYRYSRHPMYLTSSLAFIGAGIASASWILLVFSIAYMILSLISTVPEERFLLEKYGDAYREYMNRTPRYIGIPKSAER